MVERDLAGHAQQWGEEAVAKLTAKPVDVGRYDLVLHPSHLWLTIHESVAHPTELDRAMGYEANYAGTSFVSPPEKILGQLKYGPEIMNIQGDRSQVGCLGTVGWDDEGVKPEPFLIIKKGIVNDYQTTREQAAWLDWWYKKQGRETRSHGCSYAQNWDNVQFQRMPNVSLLPGEKEQSFEDSDRGNRSRDRDHRRRLVLDRPAALQRAVRRTGLPRDQGWQDRRAAQGRRVPDAHARLLELDGHDRREEEL